MNEINWTKWEGGTSLAPLGSANALYNIGTVFAILMADPGFPGGHQSKRHRRQTIIWPIFTDNCMKIKKYWTVETGCPKFNYVDPPLNLNNNNKNFIPLFAFLPKKKFTCAQASSRLWFSFNTKKKYQSAR